MNYLPYILILPAFALSYIMRKKLGTDSMLCSDPHSQTKGDGGKKVVIPKE